MQSRLPDGIYAACLTPLKENLKVDHPRLAAHARWLLENGCAGLAIMGTTGEAVSFSLPERMELLERLLEAGIPPSRIMLGVGCCALPDTVALARHALDHGVHGLLVLPPFYYKNVRDAGLIASFDALIQQIGDRRPEIYLYHFPQMTGVPFSLSVIDRLLAAYPGVVVGVKDSGGQLENMRAMAQAFPGFRVFAGSEKFLLDVLRVGGAGCISATVNLTARLAAEVYDVWQSPEADDLQRRVSAVRQAIESFPMIPALKLLTALRTGDAAWHHMRPPVTPLTPSEEDALQAAFAAARAEVQSPF
jgi:4-hydroxy-tetrahydrodipicolinate synthase